MALCVISTVGQSVFKNAGKVIAEQLHQFGEETDVALTDILTKPDFPGRDLAEATLAILRTHTNPEALRQASAELNSLDRILDGHKPTRTDALHFLASETPDGVLAARVLADFCRERFQRATTAHLIEGLQVNDGTRFRWYGLRNLINKLYDILGDAPAGTYTRILNPTGGFKGVVPYLTVVGMIEPEIEVSYIYERSPELITLAGLPLRLDFDLLEDAFEALEACSREDLVGEELLREMLALNNRPVTDHPAWSLFELLEDSTGRYYALNGLGQIAYRHLVERRSRQPVYLSKQAATTYDKLDKTLQARFGKWLDRLGDPAYRAGEIKQHGKKGDAVILKPGNVAERILYFEDDDGVLVAELVSHADDTYERASNLKRKDYDKFRQWRGEGRSAWQ